MKPLAIDLFCGLGGWTEGLLHEGYRVIGFDNHRHAYGEAKYPAQLVIQDVLTIHGSQFKDAALIVASPPCQAYSYRAMPWKKAKALPPPDNSLFEACFRIQREASEAADHFIPLVVENVCGAQKWVGRARWHYGSFYLWGDIPALMPITRKAIKGNGGPWFKDADTADGTYGPGNFRIGVDGVKVPTMGAGWYPPDHPKHVAGLAFNGHAERNLREGIKAGDRNKARANGGHEWTTGFDKHVSDNREGPNHVERSTCSTIEGLSGTSVLQLVQQEQRTKGRERAHCQDPLSARLSHRPQLETRSGSPCREDGVNCRREDFAQVRSRGSATLSL